MAVGDVVSAHTSIGAGLNWDFQPSAGVEVVIRHIVDNGSTYLTTKLFDGTNETTFGSALGTAIIRLYLTNSLYLRIYNSAAAALRCGYLGIQIK